MESLDETSACRVLDSVTGEQSHSLEARVAASSYWLDACEDMDVSNFMDFSCGAVVGVAEVDGNSSRLDGGDGEDDVSFFGDIDRILESIKNGNGTDTGSGGDNNGGGFGEAGEILELTQLPLPQQEAVGICESDGNKMHCEGAESEKRNSEELRPRVENGVCKNGRRYGELEGAERSGKRSRLCDRGGNERNHSISRYGYGHDISRDWSGKKRCRRDWEESDRRDLDRSGRRDRDGCNWRDKRDRDWRERERRGYWERDRNGKVVFHVGSWDVELNRETKRTKQENQETTAKSPEKKPEERKEKPPEEQARKYQLDVLEQAKKKNTIAFLETGAGKTLIAVLLIKSICEEMQKENKKILAIFLVPKVPLVYQQAEVIRERTGYKVGHYCGEMGQDFWDARRWQREFESKQVLVMTAQILLNILRHSIIKMEAIHLLILDECHHAVKKHPYSLVMSEFYHTTPKEKRPAVFGMTASPVNLKGVSSQEDCALKIRNLESKLDAVVCTIKDRKELEKHVPMPLEVVVEYDKAATLWSLHEQIKHMEVAVEEAAHASSRRSKWQFMGARDAGAKEELRLVYGVSERTESDGAANLIQKLRAINYALGELGQWCAYMVAHSFLTALQNDERANYQLDVKFQESYLKKVVSLLQCQLSEGAASEKDEKGVNAKCNEAHDAQNEIEEGELEDSHVVSGGEHVDVVIGAAVADGKVTPKVQSLIKILMKYQHTEDFRAIIFVERVVAALVLPK